MVYFMENPIKMDDLAVPPFVETPISVHPLFIILLPVLRAARKDFGIVQCTLGGLPYSPLASRLGQTWGKGVQGIGGFLK